MSIAKKQTNKISRDTRLDEFLSSNREFFEKVLPIVG